VKLAGAFSLFKGHIVGRNLELVPNERIVQAWRVVTWPEAAYSIVRFELKPHGSGTHVVFDHIGFPDGLHDHLERDGKKTIGRCSRNTFTSLGVKKMKTITGGCAAARFVMKLQRNRL